MACLSCKQLIYLICSGMCVCRCCPLLEAHCNCAELGGLPVHHRLVQVPMLYQLFESFPPCPLFLFLPPYRYLKCDLLQYSLSNLGSKFDVICIDPPLEEYTRRYSGFQFHQHMWDFEEVGVGHCVGVGWGDCRVTVRMCLACETLKTLYLCTCMCCPTVC